MYLIVEKDGKEINRFYDCLESFITTLWAYSVKSKTIKRAVFSTYGDVATASFTLYDTNGVIKYIYKDIPVSWGLLDGYKLLNSI